MSYLISMNLSDHRFYVYTMKGLLQERVNYFRTIHLKYGSPKAVSNNGQVFIFKKSMDLELHIIILDVNVSSSSTLSFIKTINVHTAIEKFIELKNKPEHHKGDKELKKKAEELEFETTQGEFSGLNDPARCKFYYKINDEMDVIIQVDGNREDIAQLKKKKKKRKKAE